jgi:hypothetical protein
MEIVEVATTRRGAYGNATAHAGDLVLADEGRCS